MRSLKSGGISSTLFLLSVVSFDSLFDTIVDSQFMVIIYSEQKGKMLFLLKEASKPVPKSRKRMKRSVFDEAALRHSSSLNCKSSLQHLKLLF